MKCHEVSDDPLLAPFLKEDYSLEDLNRAIASGDLVVNYRSNPNAPPFLNLLAFGAHERRIMLLLREGADPNATDSCGVTATMAAIYGHNFTLTKERGRRMIAGKSRPRQHYQRVLLSLISANADLNRRDVGGNSALALAIRYSMGDIVRVLVRYGANLSSSVKPASGEMLRLALRGLSERGVSKSLLSRLLAPILSSKRLVHLIHEYATPLPYWHVPADQCFCKRCVVAPAAPDPVVASFTGLSAKFGFAGYDSPLFVVQNDSQTSGAAFDTDDVGKLCRRLRRGLGAMKVSLTQHPLCIVICADASGKEKLTEFVFKELNATAFFIASPPVMPLYAMGQITGVVVTVDSHINIASIYEGYQLPTEFARLEVPILRDPPDPKDLAGVLKLYKDVASDVADTIKAFETPDSLWKNIIVIDEQGILTVTAESGEKIVRGVFLEHLAALHSGWLGIPSPDELKVKVKVGSPDAAWVGASVLCSLATSCGIWISSLEYSACGAGIVHRKCV